jgi:hypothetical protein
VPTSWSADQEVDRASAGFDLVEFEPPVLAPVEELFYRACIGGARVAVTDAGGEEFDEAAASALAAVADDGWQRVEPGTDERRRRCQRLGQQDRRLRRQVEDPPRLSRNLAHRADYERPRAIA